MLTFLSIIIPVYNTEKYLQECLDSVLSQKMDNIQILCVNDGSTDESISILKKYEEENNNLIVISQSNQGLSAARNTGILNACGKYILFLDSDDMLKENALNEICLQLENNDIDILLYDSDCIYETERLKEIDYKDEYYHRKKCYGGPKNGKIMFTEQIENDDLCDSACLMAIKREWLLSKSLFFKQGMIYEDCLFTFKCFMKSERMIHINKALMIYRVRERSIMTSNPTYKNVEGRLICYLEILNFMLNHGFSVRIENAIRKFAEMVVFSLKKLDSQLELEERIKMYERPPIEKLIASSMGIGIYKQKNISYRLLLLGFKALIREEKKIVIYGAGKIGKLVYDFLKMNHFHNKVLSFVITANGEVEEIDGKPVTCISEYFLSKNVLLLIAANIMFQEDMIQTAYANGFWNIEVINSELECSLKKCLDDSLYSKM